jgi:hypothetical protein
MASCELTAEMPRWNLAKRIGFRFLFVFFFLVLVTPFNRLGSILWSLSGLLETVAVPWWSEAVNFVGKRVFGVTITTIQNGSGDTTFYYIELFCWAVMAGAVTLVWTVVDRRRPSYPRLFEALRVVVRVYLAYFMIEYGLSKVVPLQFPALQPHRLAQSVGEMSPMGLL